MRTMLFSIALLLLVAAGAEANGGLAIPKDVRLSVISREEATAFQTLPAGTEYVSGVRQSSIAFLWAGFMVVVTAFGVFMLRDLLRGWTSAFRRYWLRT